jgi:hypothetical protein
MREVGGVGRVGGVGWTCGHRGEDGGSGKGWSPRMVSLHGPHTLQPVVGRYPHKRAPDCDMYCVCVRVCVCVCVCVRAHRPCIL